MAGNFTTSGVSGTTKTKGGKPNRPKMTYEVQYPFASAPEYPITDDFASSSVPGFTERHHHTNNKSGFNSEPARSPRGGFSKFRTIKKIERSRGKVI